LQEDDEEQTQIPIKYFDHGGGCRNEGEELF